MGTHSFGRRHGAQKRGRLGVLPSNFQGLSQKSTQFSVYKLVVGWFQGVFFFSIDSGFQDRLYIHNLSMKDGDFQAVQVVFVEIQDPRVKNTCRKDVRPFICVALMPIRFLYYKGFDNLDSHCYTKSP